MKNRIITRLIFLLPLFLIFLVFIIPLCKPGLIVGGDWNFPYTNEQLRVFARTAFSIWDYRELPTGSQISHQNAYPMNLLAGVWAGFGLDGISFQKITIFFTLLSIYWFSYLLFSRLTKHRIASMVGALSYLFSPLVFNYLNMGWNFVLLFLALAPLFVINAIDYFKFGDLRRAVILGLICALGFIQSQSIIWFPLIYFLIFIYQIEATNFARQLVRFFGGLASTAVITLAAHLPWISTSLYHMDSSFKATSGVDVDRFSSVFSLVNSLRGWGSLFNLQFEIAYPPSLLLFSLFPIILILVSAIVDKTYKYQRLYYFAISLILVAPAIYLFREQIAKIPFSSVIRDSSRFLVITSLGLSIGAALSLAAIKNKTLFYGTTLLLALAAYPFFSGRLYSSSAPESNVNKYTSREFRLRLLEIPMEENENRLAEYANQVNLLFPTGGTVQTKSDRRFKADFWGVSDIESAFSPYSTGLYISDKSSPLVANFANTLLSTKGNTQQTKDFLSIYGINNIFNRTGLKAYLNILPEQRGTTSLCSSVDTPASDWSITEICPIENAYPAVYTSVSPTYSSDPILKIISQQNLSAKQLALIGCPEIPGMIGQECGPATPYRLAQEAPSVKITPLAPTKFVVSVSNIQGSFILVLNKTFHPGWRITNQDGSVLNFDHLLINQLVNGWVINPFSDQVSAQYTIEFYPQEIYSRLFPISTAIFFLLTLYVLAGLKRKNEDS